MSTLLVRVLSVVCVACDCNSFDRITTASSALINVVVGIVIPAVTTSGAGTDDGGDVGFVSVSVCALIFVGAFAFAFAFVSALVLVAFGSGSGSVFV